MKNWTMDLNTTNFRIVVSVLTTAVIALLLFVAVLFFGWEPTEKQMTVLYAVGGLLAVMQGLDVAQFIGKRFSDSGYRAAANAASSPGNTAITRTGDVTITNEPEAKAVESAAIRQVLEAGSGAKLRADD